MAKLSLNGIMDYNELSDSIISDIENGANCSLIEESYKNINGVNELVLMFDKYYMRSSNRAAVTVVILEFNKNISVEILAGGGGQGMFINFSWGAEESYVNDIAEVFYKKNFNMNK